MEQLNLFENYFSYKFFFEGYAQPGKTFNDCLPCKFLHLTNILGLNHILGLDAIGFISKTGASTSNL